MMSVLFAGMTAFALGCALLQGGHNVSNTYMVHIAAKAGAGESLMGVILALSAAMELPAMSLFPRMRRRFSLRALFCLSAAMFAVRQVLFLSGSDINIRSLCVG